MLSNISIPGSSSKELRPAETSRSRTKAASLTVAIIVHVLLGLLVALIIVVKAPKKGAPIINVAAEPADTPNEATPTLKPKTVTPTSAAPSSSAIDLISVAAVSPISIPVPETIDDGDIFGDGMDFGDVSGFSSAGEIGGAVSFLGTRSTAKRVVFVVDASKSMSNEHVKLMQDELKSSLRKLPSNISFQLLLFAGPVWLPGQEVITGKGNNSYVITDSETGGEIEWKRVKGGRHNFGVEGKDKVPSFEWLEATRSNTRTVTKAVEDLTRKDLVWGTNWVTPLRAALEMRPKPDTVFFVTDGSMSGNMEKIVDTIEGLAGRGGRTKINTIGLMEPTKADGLEQIAKATGGEFKIVE